MAHDPMTLPAPDPVSVTELYHRDPLAFTTYCVREFDEIVSLKLQGELHCLPTNSDHITQALKDHLLFVKAKDLRLLKGVLGNG